MPWATEPEPLGRPLKSGRTSMSQAASSFGVAARPMPVMADRLRARPPRPTASSRQREQQRYESWTFFTSPLSCTSQVCTALL